MSDPEVTPKTALMNLMVGTVPERKAEIEALWAKYDPAVEVRIPTEAGRVFRFEAGRDSDMKPATIPN
jgi:hypothetical protein